MVELEKEMMDVSNAVNLVISHENVHKMVDLVRNQMVALNAVNPVILVVNVHKMEVVEEDQEVMDVLNVANLVISAENVHKMEAAEEVEEEEEAQEEVEEEMVLADHQIQNQMKDVLNVENQVILVVNVQINVNEVNGDDPSSGFGIKFGQAGAGLSAINWSEVTLLPFQKDFYKEAEATKSVDQSTLDEWKKEHDIEIYSGYHESIKGSDDNNNKWNKSWNKPKETPKAPSSPVPIPNPVLSFKDAADSFSPIIMKSIEKAGFEKPTPIQSATWPMVLQGKNVIGIARTGSGKTLAFLLPAIVHIKAQPKIRFGDGPIAVIIAPTRELACQIEGEVDKFACNTRHCCVYGGAKKWDQKRKLRQGVEIVIATPGRLLDFLESEVTNFKRVTYTVIDEADRLLDMGFEPIRSN
eukprot:CAMPEP_0201594258 /NCGR_PEP_ID=MMETSP0190_2-20130828/191627_1 /ASSEMBLY_ACC=CAM_ASM_000263 /TAXON_ID=37353 /ORGANISM="Rosalina sp." /LENGTH=411 /DNA_ID=CAMNT_0048053795 /DNA_START=430 /DNA_END=1664 /DNA_ORIENTATION=-